MTWLLDHQQEDGSWNTDITRISKIDRSKYETVRSIDQLKAWVLRAKEAGVVAAEQEAAVLFIVSTVRKARAGAIVSTDSNIWLPKQPTQEEKEALYKVG